MLGVADGEIFFQRLAEETRRPFLNNDVRVVPSLLLILLNPDLAVHLKREKIRTRELRIVGIFLGPRGERVVGPFDLRYEMRIRRVGAGANKIVAKRVIDPEIAHLHPAKILVTRSRDFEHVLNVLRPFGELRRIVFLGAVSSGLRGWLYGGCARDRGCGDATYDANRDRRSRCGRERTFQRVPFPK